MTERNARMEALLRAYVLDQYRRKPATTWKTYPTGRRGGLERQRRRIRHQRVPTAPGGATTPQCS